MRVNPGLRAEGLGHEDGRRRRSSSASTPSRCRRCWPRSAQLGLAFEGFHLFAGSQNLRAEAICEAQRQTLRARAAAGAATRRRRCAS
ncbi:MAG: hypothetical protein MZW92_21480 [Comamonadaceae bacterium]|nr:hypothetical protein [Comamonadaceae bacterium]